jgi:hypothetical protein
VGGASAANALGPKLVQKRPTWTRSKNRPVKARAGGVLYCAAQALGARIAERDLVETVSTREISGPLDGRQIYAADSRFRSHWQQHKTRPSASFVKFFGELIASVPTAIGSNAVETGIRRVSHS